MRQSETLRASFLLDRRLMNRVNVGVLGGVAVSSFSRTLTALFGLAIFGLQVSKKDSWCSGIR